MPQELSGKTFYGVPETQWNKLTTEQRKAYTVIRAIAHPGAIIGDAAKEFLATVANQV